MKKEKIPPLADSARWRARHKPTINELNLRAMRRLADNRRRLLLRTKIPASKTGCWLWIARKDKDGYGLLRIDRRPIGAHRISFRIFNGEIPFGVSVLHSCDNPGCVNPEHLFLGTHTDNVRDTCNKKRHRNQKVTHCPSGHPYNTANTRYTQGRRQCWVCYRAYRARLWKKKKARRNLRG